jgi:hypothetical protein
MSSLVDDGINYNPKISLLVVLPDRQFKELAEAALYSPLRLLGE